MKEKKKHIIISYAILVIIAVWINSIFVVEWLNRSLFVDLDIDIERVGNTFYNGNSFVFLLTLFIYSIVGTLIISIIIVNVFSFGLMMANNIKVAERNEFITFRELQAITSPKELLSFIEVSFGLAVFTLIVLTVFLIGLHYLIIKLSNKLSFRVDKRMRIIIFSVSFLLLSLIILNPNLYNKYVLKYEESDVHNWNPVKRAQADGFFPTFMNTIKPDYMHKPETYSKGKVNAIKNEYLNRSREINETRSNYLSDDKTILYLSESLIDPSKLDGLVLNETPVPYIKKLQTENIGGSMYSQYIGGGTANIEWSIMTGFSLEVFKQPLAITPYSDFYVQSKNHSTILSFFEKDKVAIHPYTPHLYKRRSVYNKIGMTDFLYLDNGIEHPDKLGTQPHVSDASLNKDIFRELEKKENGYLHVLTMQNHSPFNGEIPDMSYKPKINNELYKKEDEPGLSNYLQGLKASDDAIKELINKIDEQEENVNILIFGDHFPSLFRGYEDVFTEEQLTHTPWLIYMNHGRSQKSLDISKLAPNFFTAILLNEGNYKVSPFQAIMTDMIESGVKRIGSDFIVTEKGILQDDALSNELLDVVESYRIIMYDALFGNDWLGEAFYLVNEEV